MSRRLQTKPQAGVIRSELKPFLVLPTEFPEFPMSKLRLVVVGTVASDPYAGMAWMHMQITAGLLRLGHDVTYMEVTSTWPYDPARRQRVCDSDYAVPYLARVVERFGLADRWAYRRGYSDGAWLGPRRDGTEERLARADAVFNVTGATRLDKEGLNVGRLVYLGTDPVLHEVAHARGDQEARNGFGGYDDAVTYGENIGTSASPVPPLPRLRARMRQPVLLDLWAAGPPSRREFTTVGNWRQAGLDLEFQGETYLWSKHHEFLKFLDVPRQVNGQPIELATNLGDTSTPNPDEVVGAVSVEADARRLLTGNGWRLTDAGEFTTDPWRYRDYVQASRGEFTVARDLNVRLRSGWFSERSACYLAAGRPVITQDTGFGTVLPTGAGLFAFNTMDDVLAAFDAVNSNYARHSRAAREIAEEYFRAETVLAKLLDDLEL